MKQKQLLLIFYCLVLIFTFNSCSDGDLYEEPSELSSSEFFVTSLSAENIANNFKFQATESNSGKSNFTFNKSIRDLQEVKNNSRKTLFYVVNYEEGGFLILSSDKRTQPILAVSENGDFILDESLYPEGLAFWMQDTKRQIELIRASDIEQSERNRLLWENVQAQSSNILAGKDDDEEDCYDHTVVTTVGPLLSSTWSQQAGYNSSLPFITCGGTPFQVYAGCVPVAMAQIMRFHEYPTSYNWLNMPLGYSTTTTANFIEDIHEAIDNVYSGQPNYNCNGTGVSSSANMGTVLKNEFSYSSASFSGYNYNTVLNNLGSGKPVILSGSNSSTGHMWVCDGFVRTEYFYADCTGISTLYLKMNWGWYNGSYNGNYAFDNFNPAGTHYNSNKQMVYNITP